MHRRTVLAGVGSIGLAGVAGCLGAAGLDEHEATPAGVDPDVREETGYEQIGVEELAVDEEVGPSFYSEEVTAINYLTEHEKTVDMGPLGEQRGAVFVVLTTPQVSIAGEEFNPVEEMSTEELVELVESNYDEIGNIEHEEDGDVTILEQETTQSRFTADAEFDGQDVEVYLHVTEAVETDEDLLVTIGVYPTQARSEEEENVIALMEGVVEEADESESTDSDGDGNESDDSTESDGDDGDENDSEDDTDSDDSNPLNSVD
ncbi:DUF6517 family protein [Natrialbaceae archaeon GCM10025810]|uniref:DUF6517 family protein n=1 Tax=Halovalidus salilacus TaxID=3075124 RepID=UPI00361B0296